MKNPCLIEIKFDEIKKLMKIQTDKNVVCTGTEKNIRVFHSPWKVCKQSDENIIPTLKSTKGTDMYLIEDNKINN